MVPQSLQLNMEFASKSKCGQMPELSFTNTSIQKSNLFPMENVPFWTNKADSKQMSGSWIG